MLTFFCCSDVLQRHISRHTASIETSGRNKRACDRCHNSKIRCDGGYPCTACTRTGLRCKTERGSASDDENPNSHSIVPQASVDENHASHDPGPPPSISQFAVLPDLGSNTGQSIVMRSVSSSGDEDRNLRFIENGDTPRDIPSVDLSLNMGPLESLKPLWNNHSIVAANLYSTQFHHRWTILHAPSFDEEDEPVVLTSSLKMIVSWLEASHESREIALAIHDRLMDHLFSLLVRALCCHMRMRRCAYCV